MKKILSLILTLTLILPCISAFSLYASAKSDYEKLWQEKLEYEKNLDKFELVNRMVSLIYYADYYRVGFDFMLFTEQGKKLTYKYYPQAPSDGSWEGLAISPFWRGEPFDGRRYHCVELKEYFTECRKEDYNIYGKGSISAYRNVVRSLGLSVDELKEAYRRMKEEPEYVRDGRPEISDEEFKDYCEYLKTVEIPPNFVLEAACMADDEKAESLLVLPGAVYIKEIGYSVNCDRIFYMYNLISVEQLLEYDLSTDSFVKLLSDLDEKFDDLNSVFENSKDEKGRTAEERYNILLAEQNRQLKNPSTGEALYLIPVALVSLAIGALVIYPRRRKIDNI